MNTTTDRYDIVVIGGGPAGLFSAIRAASLGARVAVLEQNKQLGKKLSITGGGRCNITNAEFDTKKFLKNFGDAGKFLHSPFSQFSVQDTFDFFESKGLPLVTEARKRTFPKTQKASSVVETLIKTAQKEGVELISQITVKHFTEKDGAIVAVETNAGKFHADAFIIATGGMSAPHTGSTGTGFTMLAHIGHTIHKPNPNLVPLTTHTEWVHRLSGVSLSFMEISFKQEGKTHLKKTGKILFTHFGVSGPLIINAAAEVRKLLEKGKVLASIDCFPDTNLGDLDRRIWRLFEKHKNKQVKNVLSELVPQKIADAVLYIIGPTYGNTHTHSVTREERRKIAHILKELSFPISGTLGLDRSIVADGGVDLTEVNFKTMASRIHPEIYIVGDMLHINRPSGGFSLQLCWTTGWVAGTHAIERSTTQQ